MKRSEVTVSEHGRITLPPAVRAALRVKPGDQLIIDLDDAGHVHMRAKLAADADPLAQDGDLSRLPRILGAAPPMALDRSADDPIGDYLVAEDERTKSSR